MRSTALPALRDSTNIRKRNPAQDRPHRSRRGAFERVPRDRDGTFDPQILKKRQRRLTGVDQIVLSSYARGLRTGEITAYFAEIYGAAVSKETVGASPRK